MSCAAPIALYPRYCFHLAPTVNKWCLLRVADIHNLDHHHGFEGENFYFYKNLPIKWVRIVGIVVSVEEYAGRRFFTIDDSSGRNMLALVALPTAASKADNKNATAEQQRPIPDTKPSGAPEPDLYADIDVGDVVDVKGSISTFRSERQINIEKLVALKTTSQEVTLWEKRTKFRLDVLDVPWILREKDIRRCRREAERSEAEAEQKKARIKSVIAAGIAKQQKSRHMINSRLRDHRITDDVQRLIQNGSAAGKYSALGL